jgi:hypothetical protein
MKFSLVFDKSGNHIEFDVINNSDLLEYFVSKCNENNCNLFTDGSEISKNVDILLNELHNALSLTNSIMPDLCGLHFQENNNRLDYFDQKFLNKQHEQWVLSQLQEINIDQLRFSENAEVSKIGWRLHELYPDEIRKIKLAEAMIKLGYIYPYEEVNMTVHRLESYFAKNIEYKSDAKWQVFDNPFQSTMISNNDVVNFSFGYTYVGRQYYNKWQYYDTDLSCKDYYNYETLEYAFQLNLDRPQTIPYSKEFLEWCDRHQVPRITTQIPIANAVDIDKNLKYYRTLLYTNSRTGNRARLEIH